MTKASNNEFPSVLFAEEDPPSAPSTGFRRLFLNASNVNVIGSNSTIRTLAWVDGGSGISDQGAFTFLDATEGAAPATPASGKVRVYAKTDGRIYSKDDTGTEYGPFDAAGAGSTPLLYVDSLSLGATGDEFANMSGWTATGTVSVASTITDLPYDDDVLDLSLLGPGGTNRYTKTAPDTNFTAYLTLYGCGSTGGMMAGIAYVNTSGTGIGIAWRADQWWAIVVSSWAYSSSPTQVNENLVNWKTTSPYKGASATMRLVRSGSDITSAISTDGGMTWTAVGSHTGGSPSGSKLFEIAEFYETNTSHLLVGRLTVA